MPDENQVEVLPLPSVIIEPEGLEKTAWIAGAETGLPYKTLLTVPDWRPFVPTYEDQTRPQFDSVSCVTYSGLNAIEAQLNRLLELNLIPAAALEFVKNNGYLDVMGKFNFSDRFSAILDGTTPNGNYMSNAPDSFRNDGLIPETMLPFPEDIAALGKLGDGSAIKKYLDINVITPAMRALGAQWKQFFDIKYENVWYGYNGTPDLSIIRKYLLQSPLHFAANVCSGENGEAVIGACGCGASHARAIMSALPEENFLGIFDSFFKGPKKLALDFCIPYLYRIVVTVKGDVPNPPHFMYVFSKQLVPESVRAQHPGQYPANDGNEVIALQRALQSLTNSVTGQPYLRPDIIPVANFGPMTQAAVLSFQTDRNVTTPGEIKIAQGQVGPKTRSALTAALTSEVGK